MNTCNTHGFKKITFPILIFLAITVDPIIALSNFTVPVINDNNYEVEDKLVNKNSGNITDFPINSINEELYIKSNNTKIYARVKGRDVTKPMVLFLHGGPGEVILGLLPFQTYVGEDLEKDFVMVYMHQRGLVKSSSVSVEEQSLELLIDDVKNVVNYLCQKFKRDKIHIVGHSFGGLLATLYLLEDQSKIDSFVAVSSPFSYLENNNDSYEFTLKWAKETKNAKAIRELSENCKPPINNFEKLKVKSKWASLAYGSIMKSLDIDHVLDNTGFTPYQPEWQEYTIQLVTHLFDSLNSINVLDDLNRIEIPILFLAAANDANVPPISVKKAYDMYQQEKEYYLFNKSHHLIFVDEPVLFAKKVREFLN